LVPARYLTHPSLNPACSDDFLPQLSLSLFLNSVGEERDKGARAQIVVRIMESELIDPNASVCQLAVEFTGISCCGCVELQHLSTICSTSTRPL